MRTIAMASLLGCAALAHGQTDSGFNLHVSNGAQVRVPILDTGAPELLKYHLDGGLMTFQAGDVIGGDYDQPLFCFDFGDPLEEPVVLDVADANDHTIMRDVGLGSALKYRTADDEISLSVPSSAQCFFKDSDGTFGLFGKVSSGSRANDGCNSNPESCLFSSDFATYPELQVKYENVSSAGPGETIVYDIIISNTGDADASELAFQEVFPSKSSVYSASLSEGDWVCEDTWDMIPCGSVGESGTGPLRFQGVTLPSGAQMKFTVTRIVDQNADGSIHLHAGVVNGAGNTAENDVAEAQIDVIGEASALKFDTQPSETRLGGTILTSNDDPIVVHVVDGGGNLVSDHNSTSVTINLIDPSGTRGPELDERPVENGTVSFSNLSTEGLDVGTGYRLEAESTSVSIDRKMSNNFDIIE